MLLFLLTVDRTAEKEAEGLQSCHVYIGLMVFLILAFVAVVIFCVLRIVQLKRKSKILHFIFLNACALNAYAYYDA